MSFYVEVAIHVYDDEDVAVGVGHYLTREKAQTAADNIQRRLTSGAAKAALDEKYGEQGYSVGALALRLRTPSEAITEVITP